jgi:hypothetical protein
MENYVAFLPQSDVVFLPQSKSSVVFTQQGCYTSLQHHPTTSPGHLTREHWFPIGEFSIGESPPFSLGSTKSL